MKKVGHIFLVFYIIMLWGENSALAHGVEYEIRENKAAIIKISYDDGEPMSYAEVKIFSPYNAGIEYQNGRTDSNGCFAFIPDKPGEWKVVVNDGMGHGISKKVTIMEGLNVDIVNKGFYRWQKLITGISIIFGLTGLIFYIRVRKTKGV